MTYRAMAATPGEHADPAINPSGGPLGWIVTDADTDVAVPRGQCFMEQHEAEALAAAMNIDPGADNMGDGAADCIVVNVEHAPAIIRELETLGIYDREDPNDFLGLPLISGPVIVPTRGEIRINGQDTGVCVEPGDLFEIRIAHDTKATHITRLLIKPPESP